MLARGQGQGAGAGRIQVLCAAPSPRPGKQLGHGGFLELPPVLGSKSTPQQGEPLVLGKKEGKFPPATIPRRVGKEMQRDTGAPQTPNVALCPLPQPGLSAGHPTSSRGWGHREYTFLRKQGWNQANCCLLILSFLSRPTPRALPLLQRSWKCQTQQILTWSTLCTQPTPRCSEQCLRATVSWDKRFLLPWRNCSRPQKQQRKIKNKFWSDTR